MIPDVDLLDDVEAQFPSRRLQAAQVASFLAPTAPAIPGIIVHGLSATGKSSVLGLVLNRIDTRHVVVKAQECITGRHLLESTLAACLDAVDEASEQKVNRSGYAKCENLSALAVNLQGLLKGNERFVIVFDKIDQQREAPPTLLPALVRLNEYIPNLTVALVVTSPRQRFLRHSAIPYIHFPSYTRDETLQILGRAPPLIFPSSNSSSTKQSAEDSAWLWTRFCATVYDSQGQSAARDVVSLRQLAERLWRPFIAPILAGTYNPRDFSKLLVASRALFQSDEFLTPKITTSPSASTPSHSTTQRHEAHLDLPYYAKFLLCAAYLASFNPPRTDAVFFMKYTDKKRRKRRAAATSASTAGGASSSSKHRRVPRRLLAPAAFPLERLLAVFRALLPHDTPPPVDVCTQLATLTALRLLVRAGTGAAAGDVLDAGSAKWRVNVGWERVVALGRSVGLEVAEYAFEG